MRKKKEKIELKPEIKEIKINNDKNLLQNDLNDLFITKDFEKSNDADSFFKSVVNKLSPESEGISTKTEYLNVVENFSGSKLEFLADFGKMPYAKKFIHVWETKRISLERKGRIELVRIMEKREEELRFQQQQTANKILMGGQ